MAVDPAGFAAGYMTGVAFVQGLHRLARGEDPPDVVSVGRTEAGEVEILEHASGHAAVEHCVSRAYSCAVVWVRWQETDKNEHVFVIEVLDQRGERVEQAGYIRCLARRESAIIAKVMDASPPAKLEAFLEGFAEGSIAEEPRFTLVGAPLTYTPLDDLRRLGVAVGGVLAGELARLVDDEHELRHDIGVARTIGSDTPVIERFSDAHQYLGWTPHCAPRHAAVISFHRRGSTLSVTVPAGWSSGTHISLDLDIEVTRGQLQTSTWGFDENHDNPGYAAFIAAVDDGLASHRRGRELLAGFGALGDYRRRDESPGRLSSYLWHRFTLLRIRIGHLFRKSNLGNPQKVKKLGIRRDPAKVYTLFDGDVYAMPSIGAGTVVVMSTDRADYELVCTTGIQPEPGYIYYLDQDGDLSRRTT